MTYFVVKRGFADVSIPEDSHAAITHLHDGFAAAQSAITLQKLLMPISIRLRAVAVQFAVHSQPEDCLPWGKYGGKKCEIMLVFEFLK